MIDQAVAELQAVVGVRGACAAVGEAQARWYRRHRQSPPPPKPERVPAPQPRALSEVERKELRRVLNSEEFVDEAPATVYAKLLDQGVYLASVPTMYRVLRDHDEVHERRRQATHPAAKKPELLATKPNEVYSWDITKLLGPVKWTYYYLYVLLDIYSRYVPGWMLAHAENAHLAKALLADTATKQHITSGQLTIHADRGSPMTAKPVAFLLASLGVTKSHSRPHCSNDNPYSESQFRTMNIGPPSPTASAASRTPTPSVAGSSAGTTTSTATPASGSTPPPTSTTAAPSWCGPGGLTCSPPPTPSILSALSASRPNHRRCPRQSGSTSRRRTPPRHSDSPTDLPQKG
jgi:putative transposase